MRRFNALGMLLAALILGGLIAWVDSRPTWDDTGITVVVLLLASAGFGLARPRLAWLWALALGVWLPLVEILLVHNFGALLALAIAFVGAYIGVAMHYALRKTIST